MSMARSYNYVLCLKQVFRSGMWDIALYVTCRGVRFLWENVVFHISTVGIFFAINVCYCIFVTRKGKLLWMSHKRWTTLVTIGRLTCYLMLQMQFSLQTFYFPFISHNKVDSQPPIPGRLLLNWGGLIHGCDTSLISNTVSKYKCQLSDWCYSTVIRTVLMMSRNNGRPMIVFGRI